MRALQTNKYFRDCAFLFFITLIVYWPLSLNFLSLKNDALVQYFAYRYHLSEAIRHGFLPFWSPYLYTGFPIHADIQGAVWNPFVLFLSLISRYDMTLLQWEVLAYLYLSAIGMYRFITYLGRSRATAICCGVAFLCCGYMTDSVSVVPWIPSAAFVPFVLLYLLRTIRSGLFSDAVKFSIALSLMFLCGYPSFFIFLNYIIGIGLLVWFVGQVKTGNQKAALKVLGYFGVAYLLFIALCSPAIISYYDFLPYYSRGSGISYAKAMTNPLAPFSLLTYLLPNIASKADFLATDLSMRNTYTGLFILLFFLKGLKNLTPFKSVVLAFTIYAFLFSLGDTTPVQQWSYRFLPLMNTFRHPGTIRVFSIIGILVLASYSIEAFFRQPKNNKISWLLYGSLLLLLTSAAYLLGSGLYSANVNFSLSPAGIKEVLYNLPLQKFALFICMLQVLFLLIFIFLQSRKVFSGKATVVLFLFNSMVFAWIGLPFTVVSQYKTNEVNSYIRSFADGYPVPDVNTPAESEIYTNSAKISLHGYHNFYNKKITVQDHIITPTLNSDYYTFLENKGLRQQLAGYPFVYMTNDSGKRQAATVTLLRFTPNSFFFRINSANQGQLQLLQQYNHNWHVRVNDKTAKIKKSNIAFMSTQLPAGTSLVEWKYQPGKVYIGMIISILTVFAILFYFIIKRKAGQS